MYSPPYSLQTAEPRENSLTREDPPVREPIDFFSPHVLSARVVCFFLPIAPVLFTGSGINRDTSSLACFQLYENTSFSLLSTLADLHHFSSGSNNLSSND